MTGSTVGSRLTPARAALGAGLLATVVYIGAIGHGWTFDDTPIIAQNVHVRSLGAALAAFFKPYWPVELGAGQYRPLVILSFGLDWAISNGSPAWVHSVNLVLHGVATALFVLVTLRWLPPLGGLVAGVVFAVHPVHVEAVAGGVGRSELLVACFLFGAILAARRYRRSAGARRGGWLAGTVTLVGLALLSKEHGVVAIALLAADEWLDRMPRLSRSAPLYAAVVAVTISWLFVFERIAGRFVDVSQAATIRDLGFWDRLATVLPVQLHAARLLVWPFDLSADYNPQIIPRLTEWTWPALLGLALAASVVGLSFLLRRRYPEITFGLWLAICTYAPTSNILFASGIILAERNLYLAAGAVAIALGWLTARFGTGPQRDRVTLAVGLVVVAFGVRTVTRVPAWEDTPTLVIEGYVAHPENYRTRIRLSSILRDSDRLPEAVAEVMVGGALFPEDPFTVTSSVPLALAVDNSELAWREAERGYALDPEDPGLSRLAARARLATGRVDSSIAVARRSVEQWPEDTTAALTYAETVDSLAAPAWVRSFAAARVHWTHGRSIGAAEALRGGLESLPAAVGPTACWDLRQIRPLLERLAPAERRRLDTVRRPPECGE